MMKLTKTKAKLLFTLILAFHVMAVQAEASRDDVRILIVGIRGDSRFSTADLLSGRKDGGQEDREIVKTPVITDEGRKMMLVTGPNLCEEDTARQSFTTALFLSSPGPHAVLVVLNLEDEESERCDVVKRAQELLGAEVLQYCIVLLHRNHQERFTGASRGIAGEMINACGGRFHMIRDSEPDQTAVLLAEIDKLVWLNGDGFYSVLTQELKTEETSQDVREENDLMTVIYDALGGAAGILGWIFLISLVVYTGGSDKILFFGAKFAALLLFMIYLRHVLSPDVAIPLNLALASSLATTIERRQIIDFKFRRSSSLRDIIEALIVNIFIYLLLVYVEFLSLPFFLSSAVVSGTIISIRSWSDVLIACHAAPGVTFGAYAFTLHTETISRESPVFALWSFLFCTIGAALSIGFVTVFDLLGVKMTIMLLISALTMACWHSKSDTLGNGMVLSVFILLFPCGCALIGSVFLILGMIMSFLKVIIQNLVCSNLFYVALFLGSLIVIWRENGNNNTE